MLQLRQPRFAVLLCLAWLLVAFELVWLYWAGTAETLLDTDDAMRLAQMHAFLAGQGWFDLTQVRVQPPVGYESHWSRLIDAGLAGLLLLFQLFADGALAERLMRTVWPLLWLLPAMLGAAALAWRLAGREGALVALVLVAIGLPALQQFKPGSIDHHNVQIALAVLAVAATAWSDRRLWSAWAAGALTGLALAIGLESLPYLVVCGAAFVLRYLVDRAGTEALRAYGFALAASTALAFLVNVGPDHWTRSVCDAIAINFAAPLVLAGIMLAVIARRFADSSMAARCSVVAAVGGLVVTLFVVLEPRCLSGPFALIDPAVRPIWLVHVTEFQPLTTFARINPIKAAALMAFPVAAMLSAILLAREATLRRDFGFLVAATAFGVTFLTTVGTIKAHTYAMWLGMPLVALAALRLFVFLNLGTLLARLAVTVLLTPLALAAGAVGLAHAVQLQATGAARLQEQSDCFRTDHYAALARLPAGLVVADVDFGPFLLALTPHSVLAAPYHRLSTGIIAADRVFTAPPDEARRVLTGLGATYVVTCGSRPPAGLKDAGREASLWGRLRADTLPGWLEPIRAAEGQAFRAYRIRSEAGT